MAKAIDLSAKDFESEVLKSEVPVLVDFWAPWCMPCRMMAPILEELADEFSGKIKIVKVDTEIAENRALAIEYKIQSIPNMKLFKNGKVAAQFIGMRDKETFKKEIEDSIK